MPITKPIFWRFLHTGATSDTYMYAQNHIQYILYFYMEYTVYSCVLYYVTTNVIFHCCCGGMEHRDSGYCPGPHTARHTAYGSTLRQRGGGAWKMEDRRH